MTIFSLFRPSAYFLVSFLLLLGQSASAQSPKPPTAEQKALAQSQMIVYRVCPLMAYCMDCGTTQAELKSVPLDAYFHQKLDTKKVQALSGIVMVQVVVDTTGRACCQTVQNFTGSSNEQISALHLEKVIADMPRWQPARTGSKAENASTTVRLLFDGSRGFYADPFRLKRTQ